MKQKFTGCYLWGKTFNMVFLLSESFLRNKEWKIGIFNAHLLDFFVKKILEGDMNTSAIKSG
jgi:hypothetical protein